MAKVKISEYSATPASNTDIDNIDINENCSPSGINNAIRSLMSHLKNWQGGTSGDTLPVLSGGTGSSTAATARTALSAAASGTNSDITSLTACTSITSLTTALSVLQGGTGVTTSTGTGAGVHATSPTLVTPALGTPSALVGTNITGTAAGLSIGGNLTGAAPTAATAAALTNTTQIATTAFVTTALLTLYPVGSIYTSTVATNPNTLFGFGTWVAYGAGKVLIGQSGVSPYVAGSTGGSADAVVISHTHTATVTDPGHLHTLSVPVGDAIGGSGSTTAYRGSGTSNTSTAVTGITVANSTTGVAGTNLNLPPYVVVYMWNRTA
jgi:hypothetical protein